MINQLQQPPNTGAASGPATPNAMPPNAGSMPGMEQIFNSVQMLMADASRMMAAAAATLQGGGQGAPMAAAQGAPMAAAEEAPMNPEELVNALQQAPEGQALLAGLSSTETGKQMLDTLLTTGDGQTTLKNMATALVEARPEVEQSGGQQERAAEGGGEEQVADPEELLKALGESEAGEAILTALSGSEDGTTLLEALVGDPKGQAGLLGLVQGLEVPAEGEPAPVEDVLKAIKESEPTQALLGVLQESGEEGKKLAKLLVETAQGQQGLAAFMSAVSE